MPPACMQMTKGKGKNSPLDHRVVHTHVLPFWGVACFPKRMKLTSSIMDKISFSEKILTFAVILSFSMNVLKNYQRKESGDFAKRHLKVHSISQSVCK